ncbi:ATP-dependent DNA helicase RecG, partial [candidate division WOR-3 bacterium]|nr:ATP-dependent DNA helicase RecG [candidate division WOR-3 bacterium]
NKLGITKIGDIFYHIPRLYIDRSTIIKIINAKSGKTATILGEVVSFESRRSRKRFEIQTALIKDDSEGMLFLQWFNQPYLKKIIKKGEKIMASGEVTFYKGKQMVHPDFEIITDELSQKLHTGRIVPFYPLTEGMIQKRIRRIIDNGISLYLDLVEETLPEGIIFKEKLLPLKEAIYKIHRPTKSSDTKSAKERFIFEELFYLELLLALRKKRLKAQISKVQIKENGTLVRNFMKLLDFELTNDQKNVVKEIRDDFLSGKPMHRMLQGDVGSGKTVVAIIASLIIIESGYQVALMAPTEILAEQHYLNVGKTLESIGVKNTLLVSGVKAKEKKEIYDSLENGEINLVFGTHALIEDVVQFKNLGLVIIDEQHRFGVLQRAKLLEKGDTSHFLVMTATPIPRTLSMTLYGDLDISTIKEMPPGRKEIVTRWTGEKNRKKLYDFIREKIQEGDQCFIIYPLVEESEKIDLKAATEMYHHLKKNVFKTEGVGLLHGRMKTEEKEEVMNTFRNKEIMILVSTTVIEVGIDMPDATIMVIEHPERFGLAQLHQMRGRVGRSDKKSYCILFSPYHISDEAKERLKTIESTRDGFKIAEKDLQIRGPGEFFGTKQHGLPDLKFSDIIIDWKTLERARKRAFEIIDQDPQLLTEENKRVRERYLEKYKLKDKLGDVL